MGGYKQHTGAVGNTSMQERKVANPWTVGYEKGLDAKHRRLNNLIRRRNEIMDRRMTRANRRRNEEELEQIREEIRGQRREMKNRLKQLEI